MSLGFLGTPLYLNLKCIAFSFFVLLVFWMPHPKFWQHDIILAFVLAMIAYILMAWYDYWYDCNDRLGPTLLELFAGWAKPYYGVPPGTKPLPVKYKKIVRNVDLAISAVLVGMFFYPYYQKRINFF
jgi:hypothetical protein